MAILAVVVGIVAGFGAIGFRYLLEFIQTVAYGAHGNMMEIVESNPWFVRILAPYQQGQP